MTLDPNHLPDTFWHVRSLNEGGVHLSDEVGQALADWLTRYTRNDPQPQFFRCVDVLGCVTLINAELLVHVWRTSPADREHEAAWNRHADELGNATKARSWE